MIEELKAWRAQHPAKPLPRDMEEALVKEVEHLRGERAAVVAWLRSQVSQAAGDDDYAYDHAADAIERGEHRREEER